MRQVAFSTEAFWATEDGRLFERLTRLIKETARDPYTGIGKPEPLRHQLKGYWSRRINDEHRLIYKATEDTLFIASCRYHY